MKKLFMTTAAILLLAIFNYTKGQTATSSFGNTKETAGANTQTGANSKTEQELIRITRELLDANLHGDKKVFEHYLADNYIETNSIGKVSTKGEMLENVQVSPAGYHASMDFEDVQVQEYGNTAVMSYKGKYSAERNGQRITNMNRLTNIFIKKGKQWQLIARHNSGIPADKTVAKVDPKIYDAYVGKYELTSNHFLTLTREGDKLTGKVTAGKTKLEFLPENETTFFLKGHRDVVTFVKDDKGQVSHINHRLSDGQEVKETKVK